MLVPTHPFSQTVSSPLVCPVPRTTPDLKEKHGSLEERNAPASWGHVLYTQLMERVLRHSHPSRAG